MSDRDPLPPEVVATLRTLPRPLQALALLRGEYGPLPADVAFTVEISSLAYLFWLVYRASTRPGEMLSGRPGYEAAETFASRCRSTATRAANLDSYAHELCRGLHLRPEKVLRGEDLVWWRTRCNLDHEGQSWRALRHRDRLTEAITACGLLREWMWDLRDLPTTTIPEGAP